MMNKKILGIAIVAIMAITSTVPTYAAERSLKDSGAKQTKIEAKHTKGLDNKGKFDGKAGHEGQNFSEKAKELGVDITGLSTADAQAKIMVAQAQKLGIDTTGLTADQIKEKIKATREDQGLAERAKKLGVDITGLSKEDAQAKIMAAQAQKLGIDTTGLTVDQIKEKIKATREEQGLAERAKKLGVDITGLSTTDAQAKIMTAQA
ncbi:hypothetical protein, partial [Clostridium uliginosum]